MPWAVIKKEAGASVSARGFQFDSVFIDLGNSKVWKWRSSRHCAIESLQYFMEKFAALRPDYVIHVVSLDIVVDTTWGDASNPATREFWIGAIRAGHVLAFVGGPPCETWSRARGQPVPAESANQGPRIIRDAEQLWGFDTTTLREVLQLITGNTAIPYFASRFGRSWSSPWRMASGF